MKTIKLLIVDDHQVVRKGLKLLFSTDSSFAIVGECASAQEAIDFLANHSVDVLITDITMPHMNGLELAGLVGKKYPRTHTVILSMHLDESYVLEALDAGVKGYLLKDSDEKEIIEAVKLVSTGQMYLVKPVSDLLAKVFINGKKKAIVEKETNLTRREKEILKQIVNGLSNKMIAYELTISELTVNAHRYNIMKKLQAKNSAELVRISLQKALVS